MHRLLWTHACAVVFFLVHWSRVSHRFPGGFYGLSMVTPHRFAPHTCRGSGVLVRRTSDHTKDEHRPRAAQHGKKHYRSTVVLPGRKWMVGHVIPLSFSCLSAVSISIVILSGHRAHTRHCVESLLRGLNPRLRVQLPGDRAEDRQTAGRPESERHDGSAAYAVSLDIWLLENTQSRSDETQLSQWVRACFLCAR